MLKIDLLYYKRIKVPLPQKDVQEKIVDEIGALEEEERHFQRSKNRRATSRQAITKLQLEEFKLPLPYPLEEQQKIVAEMEATETQIAAFETELAAIPQMKEQVLKRYL